MFPFRLDRLVILAVLIILMGVTTACQQAPPPQPTPDIPATVTAQVQQHLESQPTPTVPPTAPPPTANAKALGLRQRPTPPIHPFQRTRLIRLTRRSPPP